MGGFVKSLLLALLLLSCSALSNAAASDRELEAALNQQYHDQTLMLRHPLLSGIQQYDSTGKLLSGGQEGAWTLYSGMNVRKIRLQPDKLLLEGYRTSFLYDARQTSMNYIPDKDSRLKVEVLLARPCATLEEATAIIHAVFAVTDEDLLNAVPVYWKPFIAKRAGLKWDDEEKAGVKERSGPLGLNPMADAKPPQPVYTPEPAFTDQARKHGIQGPVALTAVVNESGRVERIRIERALGMGLDEEAIAVMQKWKFNPATRDGKPVSVEMSFQVSFNR